MAASKDFLKILSKNKTAATQFKKAKKARAGSFSLPEIPDGSYPAKIGIECKVVNNVTPVVEIRWTVVDGDHKGCSSRQTFWLSGDDPEKTQRNWDSLSKAVQVLADMSDEGMEEFEGWDFPDLVAILEEIDKASPICRIGIKNGSYTKAGAKTATPTLNVFFNQLLDEDDLAGLGDDEEEEEDEEEEVAKVPARKRVVKEVEEEDEEEESVPVKKAPRSAKPIKVVEEDEEEEEEVEPVAKGEYVDYKPPRRRAAVGCIVKAVKLKAKTYNLAEVDGEGTWDDVPWDVCTPVEYDEE